MKSFKTKSKICVPITEDPNWLHPSYLKIIIEDKKKSLFNSKNGYKYKLFSFFPDLTSLTAYNTVLIQLIDDFGMQGERRKHILNPEYSYCCISAIVLQNYVKTNNCTLLNNTTNSKNFKKELNDKLIFKIDDNNKNNNINLKLKSYDYNTSNNTNCNQSVKSSNIISNKIGMYCVFT